MRRLLRLALPLGLLAALVAPTSAGAQTATDSGGTGGLTLLASSPTGLTTTSFTGDLNSSTTVNNLSVDARSVKVGSVISGTGIAPGTTVTSVGLLAGVSVDPLGASNTLAWAARLPGAAGNGITVAYNDPGGGAATLGASVAGQAVTINLGRGEVGATGIGIIAQTSSNAIGAVTPTNLTIAASPNGATESGNVVSITTTTAHGLAVGDSVNITGVGVAQYNGNFTVSTVVNTTRFTVLNTNTALAASGAGNVAELPSGVSSAGTTATLNTTSPHGLSVGQTVTVSGVGQADYNGTFLVTAIPTLSSFTYTFAPVAIAASAGSATESGNTVTITTAVPHNLLVGQTVAIAGVPVAGYNGTFTVASVTPTTFTVTNPTSGLPNSGGGTATRSGVPVSGGGTVNAKGATESGNTVTIGTTAAHGLQVGQTVTIAGVGAGGYNGDFAVASIPTTSTFTVTNPTAGLPDSGGGSSTGHSIVGNGSATITPAGTNVASIIGASEAGTTVTITTAANHNAVVGQKVVVAGVGVAGYNGTFTVASVPTGTTFTYTTVAGLAFSTGGTATFFGASEVGNTVTFVTTANHTLGVGQPITIAGVADPLYNGDFTIATVPTNTSFTVTNPVAGLAPSGGGTVGFAGLNEVGTTAWVNTRAAHGLQVGQVVTLSGAGTYNGAFTVASVPSNTSFTFTAGAGLTPSGGGSTFTVTTTAQNVIDAVLLGAGQFAAVNDLVSAVPSGAVTGRLSPNASNPPAVPVPGTFTGGVDQALGLSQAATATSTGVALEAKFSRRNTDLAFWGNTIVQGDERGIRTFSASAFSGPGPVTPLADFACNGGYGDVSVYKNLVFRSIDRPQTTATCAGSMDTFQGTAGGNHSINVPVTTVAPGFEGIRIIDITNPASPTFVKGVATDCGSFTNTLVPDLAHNRVLLYVSSFPNVGLDTTATTASSFGNTCKRNGATDRLGHSKITIVEVPLGNPASAHVLKTVQLAMSEVDPFFRDVQKIPGYTGDFSNVPGYRGCHDITVFLPKKEAAAACISDAFLLNITDPASPTVKSHFTNPYIDLCARGILRTTTGTAVPPNCMWNAAQFTNDGKYVMFSDLASGRANCSGNTAAPLQNAGAGSCNTDGNTQVGADRYYDGTATTNECELSAIGTTGLVRSPWYRGAIWVYNVKDPSFPITSFKEPRWERYSNQGCSSHLMNIVPVAGKYLTPASWQLAGTSVVNWTNLLNPTEEGWFDVNTTASESTANATPLNRPAGNDAARANAWAAYWYNGKVYVSYDSPQYGDWAPLGSRGLEAFSLGGTAAAHALTLGHMNPQTQEELMKCTVKVAGKFRVGKSAKHKVTLKTLGQALVGIKVQLKTYGITKSGTTGPKGGVTFKVKPKKARKVTVSVADRVNLLGCKVTKSVAKKKKAKAAHRVSYRPTALSSRVV